MLSLFCVKHGRQPWGQDRRPFGRAAGTSALHHSAKLSRQHRATYYQTTSHLVSCETSGGNGEVRSHASLGLRLERPPSYAIRPSSRDSVAQRPYQLHGGACSAKACMTAVTFEPTPWLLGTWSQHIALFDQSVFGGGGGVLADAFGRGVLQTLGTHSCGARTRSNFRLGARRQSLRPIGASFSAKLFCRHGAKS